MAAASASSASSSKAAAQESGGEGQGASSNSSSNGPRDQLLKLCRDVLHPLIAADGGELYLVSYDDGDVHLHLAGTCSGCPGVAMTRDRVLEPALRSLNPKLKLKLTAGWTIPPNSEKFG